VLLALDWAIAGLIRSEYSNDRSIWLWAQVLIFNNLTKRHLYLQSCLVFNKLHIFRSRVWWSFFWIVKIRYWFNGLVEQIEDYTGPSGIDSSISDIWSLVPVSVNLVLVLIKIERLVTDEAYMCNRDVCIWFGSDTDYSLLGPYYAGLYVGSGKIANSHIFM
jgi:hypothetical protein